MHDYDELPTHESFRNKKSNSKRRPRNRVWKTHARCPIQNKQSYSSKAKAEHARIRTLDRNKGGTLSVYFHEQCKSWHLTSRV